MRMLISLFFMLFFVAFMITGGIWALVKVFSGLGIPVGDKATDGLIKKLRSLLQSGRKALVPWEHEMMSLLSLNKSDSKKTGFWGKPASGTYTTIYHEPVLTFAKQRAGKTDLILAQTSDREFVFRKKDRQTEVWINGKPLGVFIDGVLLAPGSKSQMLAQLEINKEEQSFPLLLEGKPAAALTNPARKEGPNPRALTLLRDLPQEEEDLIMAMAVLQMTQED
ncbi:MAG: hypothetical protein IPL65_12580 [Lewinellaceae bacterium]|nr:hypothetical protein [Lewinellaceae bacterium]